MGVLTAGRCSSAYSSSRMRLNEEVSSSLSECCWDIIVQTSCCGRPASSTFLLKELAKRELLL